VLPRPLFSSHWRPRSAAKSSAAPETLHGQNEVQIPSTTTKNISARLPDPFTATRYHSLDRREKNPLAFRDHITGQRTDGRHHHGLASVATNRRPCSVHPEIRPPPFRQQLLRANFFYFVGAQACCGPFLARRIWTVDDLYQFRRPWRLECPACPGEGEIARPRLWAAERGAPRVATRRPNIHGGAWASTRLTRCTGHFTAAQSRQEFCSRRRGRTASPLGARSSQARAEPAAQGPRGRRG